MTVIENVMNGAKQEVGHVVSFVQSPKGPFETVDAMVRTARSVVFNSLNDVGIPRPVVGAPGLLGGQRSGRSRGQMLKNPLQKIRSRMQNRY